MGSYLFLAFIISTFTICIVPKNVLAENVTSFALSGGTKPTDVDDFECRGYDFLEMECSFTIPFNKVPVEYELYYFSLSANYRHYCELSKRGERAVCNMTVDTGYQRLYEFFNFTLIAKNQLGTHEQHIVVNNFESVVPATPEYEFKNITTDSVILLWEMKNYEFYPNGKQGLVYELLWKHTSDSVWHHAVNDADQMRRVKRLPQLYVTLRNLPFAYYDYDVSLRLKVSGSRADLWSQACVHSFRTEAKPPDAPPLTDIGSFYIKSSHTHVHLYWHTLPFSLQNGPNFHYEVQMKRNGVLNATDKIHSLSAIFPWHEANNYEFLIKSHNDLGESANASRIIIPSNVMKHHSARSPAWIRTLYDAAHETYTLSWNPPADESDLIDYTVFWCRPKQANLEECADTIDLERIGNKPSFAKTSKERSLIFAVAANYANFSTGMHWAMCAVDVTDELGKMEPEIKALPGNQILVQWNHGARCPSLIEGYIIKYCRVLNDTNGSDESGDRTNGRTTGKCRKVEIEKSADKHLLRNLKAFATYKIEMWMFSKRKVSDISDAQYIETEEDAPTPPQNLTYSNVTSSSAWISWSPPTDPKGIIRYYTVLLNGESLAIAAASHNNTNVTLEYRLENLSSFTNYTVNIMAHTKKASNASEDVHFRTLIGSPSKPRRISTQNNGASKQIRWQSPEVKSGRIEYYEVSVMRKFHDGMQHQHISIVLNTPQTETDSQVSCDVYVPACHHVNDSYEVQVRAVNVAVRNIEFDPQMYSLLDSAKGEELINAQSYDDYPELACISTTPLTAEMSADLSRYRDTAMYVQLPSVWEKGPTYGCGAQEQVAMIVIMYVILAMLFACMCLLLSFLSYKKIRIMSGINIKLPGELRQTIAGSGFDNKYLVGDYHGEPPTGIKSSAMTMSNEHGPLLSSISRDSGIGDSTPPGIYPELPHIVDYCKTVKQQQQQQLPADGYTPHGLLVISAGEQQQQQQQQSQQIIANDNYMVMSSSQSLKQPQHDGYVHPSQAISTVVPDKNGYIQVRSAFLSAKPQEGLPSRPFSIGLGNVGIGIGIGDAPAVQLPEPVPAASGYVRPNSLALSSAAYIAPHIFATTSPRNTSYVTPKDLLAMKPQMFNS